MWCLVIIDVGLESGDVGVEFVDMIFVDDFRREFFCF